MDGDMSDTQIGDNSNSGVTPAVGDTVTSTSPTGIILPSNPDDTRCYCGKERVLSMCELQCGMCLRFYHAQCLSVEIGPSVPFLINYQFFCKRCSSQESFTKRPASFSQMCHTTVANLTAQYPDQKFFSKDKEIIPFVEENWECLTTAPRRVKPTWHTTVGKTMLKDVMIFNLHEDGSGDQFFGLVNQDLTKIGPNCESLFRLATASSYRTEQKSTVTEAKHDNLSLSKSGRASKRKTIVDGSSSAVRNRKGELQGGTRLVPRGYPTEHPFNKDGYRYILAEPDTHAPNWHAFDESVEWAGKPIPGYLYRKYLEPTVLLALHDRAPQLRVSDDRISVTGEKGYSMIRGTYGVSRGAWYFEVIITDMPLTTSTRIGLSQSLGNLQAPCGYDKFSYSWRSRKGTTFHQSRGQHYAETGYGQGDVLGVYVDLAEPRNITPSSCKEWPLVKFKSHLYYEEKDNIPETEKKLQPLSGSKIVFYRNGESQGVAYKDVFEGTYFPAISLYKHTTVTMNFGPDFQHPPKDLPPSKYKPFSQAAEDQVIEYTMADILYHIENEDKLPEF